jgi:hypothetical protein
MFLQHVGPQGALWKAWVAVHWEKRLKKQDYKSADVAGSVKFTKDHARDISLRCLGHLLLGFCKILLRKVMLLDDRALEVGISLQTSSRTQALPLVRTVAEGAVTLSREPQSALLGTALDANGLNVDLDLLFLPEDQAPAIEVCLEEGLRHTVPEQAISLPGSRLSPQPSSYSHSEGRGPEEAFGAPSVADQAAMEELRAATSAASTMRITRALGGIASSPDAPTPHEIYDEMPPEVEALLAASGTGSRVGDSLRPHSGDPYRLGDFPGMDSSIVPSHGLGSGSLAPLEPPPITGLLDLSVDLKSPLDPARQLHFDDTPLVGLTDRIAPNLVDSLFSPQVPGADVEMSPAPIAGVAVDTGADEEAAPKPLVDARDEPLAPVDEENVPQHPPPRKRRRRQKQYFDIVTTIPSANYKDTSGFTLDLSAPYPVYLPHRRPGLPFTTASSEMCDWLAEPLTWAVDVGERLRQMRAASVNSATPLVGGLETTPQAMDGDMLAPPSVEGLEDAPQPSDRLVLAPSSRGGLETSPAMRPIEAASDSIVPLSERPEGGELSSLMISGAVSPQSLIFPAPVDTSPVPIEFPSIVPSPVDPQRTEIPVISPSTPERQMVQAPTSPATVQIDPSFTPQENDPARQSVDATPLGASPIVPSGIGTHASAEVTGHDFPQTPIEDRAGRVVVPSPPVSWQSRGSSPPGPWHDVSGSEVEISIAPSTAVSSFFEWCEDRQATADDAARGFMSLLTQYMDGAINMAQDMPYGDIVFQKT